MKETYELYYVYIKTRTMKIKKTNIAPQDENPEIKPDLNPSGFSSATVVSKENKTFLYAGAGIFLIAVFFMLYFFVFNKSEKSDTKTSDNSSKYDELKRKELELKERELNLKEKQLNSGSVSNNENENDKDEIRNVVNNMLTSWQNKSITGFFSNLTGDYRYESIDGIKRNYDQRLSKAYEIFANNSYISINTWDMNITTDGDIAEVTYRQDYRSTLLSDVTTKKLFLRKENNTWKVYKELSGFN